MGKISRKDAIREIKKLAEENQNLKIELQGALEKLQLMSLEMRKKDLEIDRLRAFKKSRIKSSGHKILGWNIVKAKDGYFRAFKRFNGKMEGVYLGKNLDTAQQKIKSKMGRMGKKNN